MDLKRAHEEYVLETVKLIKKFNPSLSIKNIKRRYCIDLKSFEETLQTIRKYPCNLENIIIETGLDLPSILRILMKAKKFGLINYLEENIEVSLEKVSLERTFGLVSNVLKERSKSITAKTEYNQRWCDEKSIRYFLSKLYKDRLSKRHYKIICLGDDDLIGLATGFLPNSHVSIVDIDEDLLRFIKKVSSEKSLDVEVRRLDLREELPRDLQNHFEIFICDPPWTVNGIRLFLTQALCSLRNEKGCWGYLFIAPFFLGKEFRKVEMSILQMGFEIVEIVRSCKKYPLTQEQIDLSFKQNKIKKFMKKMPYITSNLYILRLSSLRYKKNLHKHRLPKDIFDYFDYPK